MAMPLHFGPADKANFGGLAADWPTSVKVLLGRYGVVNVTGEEHLRLRKTLNPSFRLGPVNEVVPHMAALATRCCDKWAGQGRVKGLLAAKEYTFLVGCPGRLPAGDCLAQ